MDQLWVDEVLLNVAAEHVSHEGENLFFVLLCVGRLPGVCPPARFDTRRSSAGLSLPYGASLIRYAEADGRRRIRR